jgi:hypothetical protein
VLEFREMVALVDRLTIYKHKIGRCNGPFVATVDFWISEQQSRSHGHTLTGRRDEERYG